MPLYASAPIAYDGPVYARVDAARWSSDCTLIKEFLGLFKRYFIDYNYLYKRYFITVSKAMSEELEVLDLPLSSIFKEKG